MTVPDNGTKKGSASGDDRDTGSRPAEELSLEDAIDEVEAEEHEYRPPAAGPLSNVITAAAIVVLGVAALLGSSSLGVGSASEPGPGTWPLLISIMLVVLGVVLLAGGPADLRRREVLPRQLAGGRRAREHGRLRRCSSR